MFGPFLQTIWGAMDFLIAGAAVFTGMEILLIDFISGFGLTSDFSLICYFASGMVFVFAALLIWAGLGAERDTNLY